MMGKDDYLAVIKILVESEKKHVLFIGDSFQLPPVNEAKSLSFDSVVHKFELTEPVRFDPESGIAHTAVSIRNALQYQLPSIEGMADILHENEDVIWVSAANAAELMIDAFTHSTEPNDVRMISFTNERVNEYNYHLKLALTGNAIDIVEGDLLVANSSVSQWNTAKQKEVVIIHNNTAVTVKSSTLVEEDDLVSFKVALNGYPDVSIFIINHAKDRDNLKHKIAALTKEALSFPLGSSERRELFKAKFALERKYPDFRVSYAQTIHKSQGSTYKVVFLDMTKLNTNSVLGRHLLYTGVTRASHKLVIFK